MSENSEKRHVNIVRCGDIAIHSNWNPLEEIDGRVGSTTLDRVQALITIASIDSSECFPFFLTQNQVMKRNNLQF